MKTQIQNQIRPMILLMLTMLFSASWAQNTITVQLRDSDGNTLPDANTARLWYYSGGQVDFTNDGQGNFEVPVLMLPLNVTMDYHCGGEARLIESSATSPVIFNTLTFTVVLQDLNGQLVTGGTYTHRTSTMSPSLTPGTVCEILPGWHYLNVWLHTGQVTRDVWVYSDNHQEVFQVTYVTPRLIDCEGIVAQELIDPAWKFTHGCVGPCLMCQFNQPHPALVGCEQTFTAHYGNITIGSQTVNPIPAAPVVITFLVPCTFSFRSFPNTIGILVWHDADGDGTQTGEQNLGIAGVTVKLTKPNGTLLMTGVTNAQGIVTFENYPMNQPMKIRFVLPNGYEFTNSSGSIFNPMNSDASNNGNTNAFQGTGEFIGFVDCGLAYSSNKTVFNYTQDFNCYPNPASTLASLTYYLYEDALVNISAYNLAGQKVAIIDSGVKAAGQNTFDWDVTNLEPGIYFLRYEVSQTIFTERFVITR